MTVEPIPFAVDLSNDGIFLWHRKPAQKWEFLGSVPLSSGNIRQQLERLKVVAEATNASSNDAIVRIPTAEVQTLTVAYDPDADAVWEVRIVSALEEAAGQTIRNLAFDIDRGDGTSDISVAWTPNTVVEQAETFVHLIGFKPAYYTTDLDVSDFPRNPNFQLVDYQAIPKDIFQDNMEIQPEEQEIEIEIDPSPIQHAFEMAAPQPQTSKPDNEFGYLWFIALFLILILLIAAIYYWPRYQQSAGMKSITGVNQPFFASVEDVQQFTLKKAKQPYS